MTHTIRSVGAGTVIVATLLWGCDSRSTSTVTAPSSLVTGVAPPAGSTAGGTAANISGTGFLQSSAVTFGGVNASVLVARTTSISVITPVHPAGTVDVVVTDPSGSSITMPAAYTYVAGAPPTVSALSPNVGSTGGGDLQMRITGSGFQPGARIALGGVSLQGFVINSTTLVPVASIPAHVAGTVDVAVINADGQSATMTNGFTYAAPESFDVNGSWEGAFPELTTVLKFTIQSNLLTSLSCGTSEVITFIPPPVVSGGAFSASRADGVSVSGRIVAPSVANGTVSIPGCPVKPWVAEKK